MKKHAAATQKLHEMGFANLCVYKESWGWKVWDTNLSGAQYWNDLKRNAMACVPAVKRGVVPVDPAWVNSKNKVTA